MQLAVEDKMLKQKMPQFMLKMTGRSTMPPGIIWMHLDFRSGDVLSNPKHDMNRAIAMFGSKWWILLVTLVVNHI
jgi:hypothetical protein